MTIPAQIKTYINSQPEPKRSDLLLLHEQIMLQMPGAKRWFLDGKNEEGKIVSNPNIGYGQYSIQYANGEQKAFYQVGLSANTSGISVYIMGIKDNQYLPARYAKIIGKASVTGYCIRFKSVQDIQLPVLLAAIRDGVQRSQAG